jgi:uncharacterized protein YegL
MASNFLGLYTTIVSLTRKLSLSTLLSLSVWVPCFATVKEANIVGRPTIEGDRVTLRVKVIDGQDRPVVALTEENFKLLIDNQPLSFDPKDWKSPKESTPPPAWIVVLLDMSGSMRNKDTRGKTKLQGALEAIQQFRETLSNRSENLPTENIPQLAIVPFGEGNGNSENSCKGFPITTESLDKFFPVTDFKLQNHLEYLSTLTPCASTNLYEPLGKAIRMLGNTKDARFYSENSDSKYQPRLSIILLSDGYQNTADEQQAFDNLQSLIKRNPKIIVHTLGYGLTPEALGRKYRLKQPAIRRDIWSGDCGGNPQKAPLGNVCDEDFVDKDRLLKIAQLSGGIGEFSADAQAVSEKLDLFLDALLGEYEITFTQPVAERGSKHEAKVIVKADDKSITSPPQTYTITVFGRSVSLPIRLSVLLLTLLALAGGGVLPFWMWSKGLKQAD